MKILLTTGIYPPDIGGPATFIPELAITLVEMGHEVTILTLTNDFDRVEDSLFTTHFISRRRKRIFRQLKTLRILLKYLRNHDVVFANGLHEEVGTSLRIFKNFGGFSVAKIVGDPVWERAINANDTKNQINEFSTEKNLKYRLQRRFLVASLNNFSLITAPSRELLSLTNAWGVIKPKVHITNGIRISDAYPEVEVYDLITVSRLTQWKNIDHVISIAVKLNLRLAIVGSGPEFERLENFASGHTRIEFLGERSNMEIEQLLLKSKIYIALSSYEGLSFSLLKAMSLKRTCIVSDIPGNSQAINNQENGILVSSSDTNQLELEIQNCLGEAPFRTYLGENARTTVIKDFDIRSYARILLTKVESNA